MTLQEWVEAGAQALRRGPHPERARADAEFLLRFLLNQERAALLARWTERLDENEAGRYREMLARRRAGEPIQYITGETEFYGLPFRVTPAVLIPRPETEHLVEKVLLLCRDMVQPRILDIGTGSGAIAVALAHELHEATVTAIDISAEAIAIARENAARNRAAVRFLQGDLLAPVTGERFDVVASNPPYVSSADRDSLAVEVRDHEPHSALFAGFDGLAIFRRLIPQALDGINPGGYVVLEIGYDQRDSIHGLLSASGFENIEFIPDLQGIARVAVGRRP
ncbi:MAG TPA: peptide chain release factor N(5)-glutamine methyltransferase [Terracidiphilus sp.]|jgi:release factor glutamine methyltransferase